MDSDATKVDTTAGTLAVRILGEGPAVLLTHGLPGSGAAWEPVAERLAAAGSKVLVPDLLGFGASAKPRHLDDLWLDAQVSALTELLSVLEVGPVVAVGHDFGAPTCVTLAHRRPAAVTGLVLAAGNLFTDTPIPLPLRPLTLPVVGGPAARLQLSAPMLRMMLRTGVGRPRVPLDADTYLGDAAQQRSIRTILAGALRELPARYQAVSAALDELPQPTEVLWGDRDPFFGVEQGERLAATIPQATLRIEPGAGHFLPAERPGAFVDAVERVDRPGRDLTA